MVAQPWLLLTYKVPPEPAAKRIALWRRLKGMGAVYLQNGVCLLPKTDEHVRRLKMLENDVGEMGGEAVILETVALDIAQEEKVVARFKADRDDAYRELIDKCDDFESEIAKETASFRRKFTVKAAEFALVGVRFYHDADAQVPAPAGGLVSQTLFFKMARPSLQQVVKGDETEKFSGVTVNDGHGHTATGTTLVCTQETAPVANAGAAQKVALNQAVQLDASGSADPDGEPARHHLAGTTA